MEDDATVPAATPTRKTTKTSSSVKSSYDTIDKDSQRRQQQQQNRRKRRIQVSYSSEQGFRSYMEDDYFLSVTLVIFVVALMDMVVEPLDGI
jgi:hypothetical protein